VDPLAVFYVETRVHADEVTELNTQVVAGDLVYLDAALFDVIRRKADEDGVAPFLSAVFNNEKHVDRLNTEVFTARSSYHLGRGPKSPWCWGSRSRLQAFKFSGVFRSRNRRKHTRVVVGRCLIDQKPIWPEDKSVLKRSADKDCTNDFLGLRMAVEMSLGPG
jgi:hypothetical protein